MSLTALRPRGGEFVWDAYLSPTELGFEGETLLPGPQKPIGMIPMDALPVLAWNLATVKGMAASRGNEVCVVRPPKSRYQGGDVYVFNRDALHALTQRFAPSFASIGLRFDTAEILIRELARSATDRPEVAAFESTAFALPGVENRYATMVLWIEAGAIGASQPDEYRPKVKPPPILLSSLLECADEIRIETHELYHVTWNLAEHATDRGCFETCVDVCAELRKRFGVASEWGVYVDEHGQRHPHEFIRLPDGSVLDPTHDQFGGLAVVFCSAGSAEERRYLWTPAGCDHTGSARYVRGLNITRRTSEHPMVRT